MKILLIFTFVFLHVLSARATTIHSVVFSDVISSQGLGNINLFKTKSTPVDGPLLEAFRQDNDNKLVFAIDVNEAADGSENSDSQGIAIEQASLTLTIAGEDFVYTNYYTKTQTLLKGINDEFAKLYYSVVGEAGSSLITPSADSELNNTSMDALLTFPIEIDLSQVSAATLNIKLLKTDDALGDPESFYDFTNGFEDVALVTQLDAMFLDGLARGIDLAPMVIVNESASLTQWTYFPGSDTFYVASFEDLYPNKGDYDFNDLVVAYQLKIGKNYNNEIQYIRGNGYLIARGAEYDHDFYLSIELPQNVSGEAIITFNQNNYIELTPDQVQQFNFAGPVNLKLVSNVASHFFDGQSTYVNTFTEQTIVQGPRFDFEISLTTPTNYALAEQAPFDPFIFVHDTNYEVHTANHDHKLNFSSNKPTDTFRDEIGFPFALILIDDWMPPLAGIDMGEAYPNFVEHVKSNGATNKTWFSQPQTGKIKAIPFKQWQW